MKAAALIVVLSFALIPCAIAQKTGPHDAEFRTFYAGFLAAVRANDKEKIADMIAFPIQTWSIERRGNVEQGSVKDRADFIARYNVLFTSFMRLHVPRARTQMFADGKYLATWHDAGTEFSFEFDYVEGVGYRIYSYDIGPE